MLDAWQAPLADVVGIGKGLTFTPDAATKSALAAGLSEAQAWMIDAVSRIEPFWPGSRWGLHSSIGPKTGFTFEDANYLDTDGRGMTYFLAYAPPMKLGKATFYLTSAHDTQGQPLHGARTYRLHVPPDVPAQQFWAATVYDSETCAFIRDAPKLAIDSYEQTQKNADGSVDIYFGPKAPAGKEQNWIYTAPGRGWITMFRFYGPTKALFEKTWTLPDIEPVE